MGCRSVLEFLQSVCRLFVIPSQSIISRLSSNKFVQHAVQCRDEIHRRTIWAHFEHIEYKFP